uniref:Uncharacterized protein n=1 Tax=Panagrolaimus davidi TaxID=227884 RepID=A0A914QFT8_9BILA
MGSWLSKLMKLRRNSSEMIPTFTQTEFRATYCYQNFALPDSIIFYMAKNPQSSKVYQKMIKSCKYFFIKNPILVIPQLYYNPTDQWHTNVNERKVCLKGITSKIWVSQNMVLDSLRFGQFNDISFYRCDAKIHWYKKVSVINFFAPKCDKFRLYNSAFANDNGSILLIDAIISALPKLKSFSCKPRHPSKMITFETVKKLLCIPHFYNLEYFHLTNIPESFDIGLFYEYIKVNKKAKICLHFSNQISQAYKNRLKMIAKDIIKRTKNQHNLKVPVIKFNGI